MSLESTLLTNLVKYPRTGLHIIRRWEHYQTLVTLSDIGPHASIGPRFNMQVLGLALQSKYLDRVSQVLPAVEAGAQSGRRGTMIGTRR